MALPRECYGSFALDASAGIDGLLHQQMLAQQQRYSYFQTNYEKSTKKAEPEIRLNRKLLLCPVR